MSELKHTPGPWRQVNRAEGNVDDESGRLVANCMGYSSNIGPGNVRAENIANAELIAAAPTLLEENSLLKSDIQYVREENELLKERCSVLLQALVDYFNHSVPIDGTKALSANLAVAHLIQKYAAL